MKRATTLLWIILISLCLILFCDNATAEISKKDVHILILSSYNRSEHLNTILFDAFEKRIEERDKSLNVISDIFTINFLEKWQPVENQIVLFLKAKSVSFDFCIVVGGPASDFFKIHRNEIVGPSVPVIYIGENLLNEKGVTGTAYLSVEFDLTNTIKLSKIISKNTIIVYDSIPTHEQSENEPDHTHLKFRSQASLIDSIRRITEERNNETFSIIFKSALDTEIGLGYADNQHAILDIHDNFPNIPIFVVFDYIFLDTYYDFSNIIAGGYVISNEQIVNELVNLFFRMISSPNSIIFSSIKNNTLRINYPFLEKYPRLRDFPNATVFNTPHSFIREHYILISFMGILIITLFSISFLLYRNRGYIVQIKNQMSRFQVLFNNISLSILEVNIERFYHEVINNRPANIQNHVSVNNINRYGKTYLSCDRVQTIHIQDWLDPEEIEKISNELCKAIRENNQFSLEVSINSPVESERRFVFLLNGPNFKEGLDLRNVPFNLVDITDRAVKEITLQKKTERDYLTGILNKEAFLRKASGLFEACRNTDPDRKSIERHLDIIFIDLDKFKPVNDVYGHNVGDILLQKVCSRITNQIRKTDLFGRMGGDEFCIAILYEDAEKVSGAVANKIISQLYEPFSVNNITVSIGCSIGISRLDNDTKDILDLIKRSDIAMYQSKKKGGKMITYYDNTMGSPNE